MYQYVGFLPSPEMIDQWVFGSVPLGGCLSLDYSEWSSQNSPQSTWFHPVPMHQRPYRTWERLHLAQERDSSGATPLWLAAKGAKSTASEQQRHLSGTPYPVNEHIVMFSMLVFHIF